jgi:hypothetical protein
MSEIKNPSAEDDARMKRLVEEVYGRMTEMSMIVARSWGPTEKVGHLIDVSGDGYRSRSDLQKAVGWAAATGI